mgnify:CR=1 FL=1
MSSSNALRKASSADAADAIARIAGELTGVQFTERHRSMIESRLLKRIRELSLTSLEEYLSYYRSHADTESTKLISLLTTHHTAFFREFTHFDYLSNEVLPKILPELRKRPDRTLRIWSAACSRGQEVYSLAMYLEVHLKRLDPTLKFRILGTDVDPESVGMAKNGVYPYREIKEAPLAYLGNHWARGTGDIADFVKARETLRANCSFRTDNLLKPTGSPTEGPFDIIFCRNVFIYFSPEQITQITARLTKELYPHGYFFIGVSESLNGLKVPVKTVGPSIYQFPAATNNVVPLAPRAGSATSTKTTAPKSAPTPTPSAPAPAAFKIPDPIRVLCVDDSPSVLTLLKKVFERSQGFEIVGTAANGLEALEKRQALKPDLMTLDIHMPEQNGIEYLEKGHRGCNVPVIMISSVSREDSSLAGQALALGAMDYVEKPALANFENRSEEIRSKAKSAVLAAQLNQPRSTQLDKSFQKTFRIQNPQDKARILWMPTSARGRALQIVSQITAQEPPTYVVVEGTGEGAEELAKRLSAEWKKPVELPADLTKPLGVGKIGLVPATRWSEFLKAHSPRPTSIMVLGSVSKPGVRMLQEWPTAQLLLEDLGATKHQAELLANAADVGPLTSFHYQSGEFLCREQAKSGNG